MHYLFASKISEFPKLPVFACPVTKRPTKNSGTPQDSQDSMQSNKKVLQTRQYCRFVRHPEKKSKARTSTQHQDCKERLANQETVKGYVGCHYAANKALCFPMASHTCSFFARTLVQQLQHSFTLHNQEHIRIIKQFVLKKPRSEYLNILFSTPVTCHSIYHQKKHQICNGCKGHTKTNNLGSGSTNNNNSF